jgi:uncharacterized protein involved in exopolysaccharide biosynthesis
MTILIHPQIPQATLFGAFKRHTKFFLMCGALGGGIAISIAYNIPKQWSATLLFQVGQIGSNGNLLAPPNSVVQRVKFSGFVNQVLRAENLPTEGSWFDRSTIIKKTLNATSSKDGNLLQMTVKGRSPEEAKENVLAAFHILQVEHLELLMPSVTRFEKNLADAITSLQKIEDERATILGPIKRANSAGTIERKFSESILLASMLKSSEAEIRIFRDQINSLNEQLSPYRTFNTKEVAPIYVPRLADHPKKSLAAMMGIFLGILFAAIYVFCRDKELRGALSKSIRDDI